MSSVTSHPYNYSIHSIPGAFALGLVPHLYVTSRLMLATRGQMSLSAPRTNLDSWKGRMSNDLWLHLTRARGAHVNSMEVFPLFAAAMIAGNVAKLPAEDLNSAAMSFLVARTLYIGLYMGIKNNGLALARTGVYAWSITIPTLVMWKAGRALQD